MKIKDEQVRLNIKKKIKSYFIERYDFCDIDLVWSIKFRSNWSYKDINSFEFTTIITKLFQKVQLIQTEYFVSHQLSVA